MSITSSAEGTTGTKTYHAHSPACAVVARSYAACRHNNCVSTSQFDCLADTMSMSTNCSRVTITSQLRLVQLSHVQQPHLQAALKPGSCSNGTRVGRMQRASKRIKLQAPCNSSSSGEASRNVVITGGTRGLGWAMARDFCQAGDRVLICGRDEDTVGHATRALWGQCGRDSALGVACDVSRADDVRRLGRFARQALGDIDLWVNCAGGGRVTPGSTAPASEPQQRA